MSERYLKAVQDRIRIGGTSIGNDACFEKWRIVTSDGKEVDCCNCINTSVDEFLGRPVVKLMVRPYRQPVMMHREMYLNDKFFTWSNHICGGTGKSVIPDAREWLPIDLVRF